MSESSPLTDAAKRAAARKAKILARGNTGLQKLAQTARGEEADKLYGESSRPTSPGSDTKPTSTSPAPDSTSAPWAAGSSRQPTLNPEQQRMQEQLAAMFGAPGDVPGAGGMPDMSQLMAQMMGMQPPQNLLEDMDDPAGLNGSPFGDGGGMPPMPPGLADMFSGMPGMQGMPGMPGAGPKRLSKSEKYFPLVHVVSMVLLGLFCILWWEPSLRDARWAGRVDSWWARRWAGLAGRPGWVAGLAEELLGGVEVLPLFWAFTTVQLILQTTRIMILRSPAPPHSLISTFLPLMPPAISRPLITGSRYLSLLSQVYKDGALLIFFIGMTTVLGQWRSSGVAPIHLKQ